MTWHDVTVFQWQQLIDVSRSDDSDADKSIKTASILTGKTEAQIRKLTYDQLQQLAKSIEFIGSEMPQRRLTKIKANGNHYQFRYDVDQMPIGRYIEAKHFAQDFTGNLHKIAASMCIPMKRTITGPKAMEFNPADHSRYANDLQSAPVVEVLGSVTFFYLRLIGWIRSSADCLAEAMRAKGMREDQIETVRAALWHSMDGFIRPRLSLNISGLNLTGHI